ncbi:DNA repair protein RecN [Fictibacillus barbaricus]|uniref:DNA repair protein RecN n=1 Tax=Fictibacillus barbaricus TaxID=182136 RepID=A0ABU1TZT1_9BACL|nr:DNA repair protein RecN [Fictibacillus barbaricus]MDR7072673.1 DNA repair protein RecN (Recombination protein N) [Fictibacillus barbaricus]
MLAELSIRNFAIIDELSVSFNKGLTVLTGETGAGKSIIIDAIGLLIGGRGSTEFVRYGTPKAEIEGLFHIHPEHRVYDKCGDVGISITDEMVVLKRDITDSGKSICRVNGKLVTLSVLKEIGQALVDIHGQHETQYLMQPDKHLFLLDSFGDRDFKEELVKYENAFKEYKDINKQLSELSRNEQEIAQRIDLLEYQLEEITSANLLTDEDVKLEDEKKMLSNFESIHEHLQDAYYSLYGEGKGLELVSKALEEFSQVAALDESLKTDEEQFGSSYYVLEELTYKIRDMFDSLEYNPDRLNHIEMRLDEISKLKRKYGNSVKDIIIYGDKISKELELIQNKDNHIEELKSKQSKILTKLSASGKKLTKKRIDTAKKLKNSIQQQLKELYMEKTEFEVIINQVDENQFLKTGMDNVEFYISPNQGEPLKPLSKVASGGELSRVILALKTIFSENQGITAIIFDEVDTGVSGRVAQAIAEKIYRVSVGSQVLCISHLPQVAAMADTHLHISKLAAQGRTVTKVLSLKTEEKVNEIGRMISGVEITDLTKKHAEELLQIAESIKKSS